MVDRCDCNAQGSWTKRWVVRGKQDAKDHLLGRKGGVEKRRIASLKCWEEGRGVPVEVW